MYDEKSQTYNIWAKMARLVMLVNTSAKTAISGRVLGRSSAWLRNRAFEKYLHAMEGIRDGRRVSG